MRYARSRVQRNESHRKQEAHRALRASTSPRVGREAGGWLHKERSHSFFHRWCAPISYCETLTSSSSLRKCLRVGCGVPWKFRFVYESRTRALSAKHAGPTRQQSLQEVTADLDRHVLKCPWRALPRLRRFGATHESPRDSLHTFCPVHPHRIPGGAVCAPTFLKFERIARPDPKPAFMHAFGG